MLGMIVLWAFHLLCFFLEPDPTYSTACSPKHGKIHNKSKTDYFVVISLITKPFAFRAVPSLIFSETGVSGSAALLCFFGSSAFESIFEHMRLFWGCLLPM